MDIKKLNLKPNTNKIPAQKEKNEPCASCQRAFEAKSPINPCYWQSLSFTHKKESCSLTCEQKINF